MPVFEALVVAHAAAAAGRRGSSRRAARSAPAGSRRARSRRRKRPTGVTRGSSRILNSAPSASFAASSSSCWSAASAYIVRNLSITNGCSFEPDAAVAVEHGPARAELDRRGDGEPDRQADDDDQHAHDEVERALDEPVGAGERRRRAARTAACPGRGCTRRARSAARWSSARPAPGRPAGAPVSTISSSCRSPKSESATISSSTSLRRRAPSGRLREAAEHGQLAVARTVGDDAEEVVRRCRCDWSRRLRGAGARLEPSPTRSARRRTPAQPHHLAGQHLVARAQEPDQDDGEDERGRARARRCGTRGRCRSRRRAPATATSASEPTTRPTPARWLALGVEAGAPEDEHRDERRGTAASRVSARQSTPQRIESRRSRARAGRARRRGRA